MKALSTPFLRLLLPLLLGLLGSCAVYDRVFHPHRLPTPPLSATAKAKARAAEKARHKGTSLKATEAAPATDGAGDATDDKKKTMSYSDLPEGTKLKYDKQGLVKKSTLERLEANRRQRHHYDTRPLTPREASRENRKLRKKGHRKPGKEARDPASARSREMPPEPAPDPTPPPTPAPASQPAKEAAKKLKKAPVLKPDPTQPAPDGSRP